MKRVAIFLFLILNTIIAFAGDNVLSSRQSYINEHKDDAIRDMKKTGVPASITLAQACLESQDGRSALAREANNHFGIKCSNWTGASYIQDDDTKDECFRKYNSTLESYIDHSNFLLTRPRYAFLFQLDKMDYKGWAHGLKKAGYATDPNYATRLIKIIEENQLHLYDNMSEEELTASASNDATEITVPDKKVFVPSVTVANTVSRRDVISNNGIECVKARKGDSFKSLAKELKLGYWQLPKYNEADTYAEIEEGQLIYLKPKKSESWEGSHIVQPGEDAYSIAQRYGIKLKYIYKYNNLKPGDQLESGQMVVLKKSTSKS